MVFFNKIYRLFKLLEKTGNLKISKNKKFQQLKTNFSRNITAVKPTISKLKI